MIGGEMRCLPSLAVLASGREVPGQQNSPALLKDHEAVTKGVLRFRFPPEPNGYLHIGHAKSMHLNFGCAKHYGGKCFLRFDDTNPESERPEFVEKIKEMIAWMGWKADWETHASQYFDQLYAHAAHLAKIGLAYVDHSTVEMMNIQRRDLTESPWRNRPIEENVREFRKMRNGYYNEGEAILRLKMDMKSDNPNMRDVVAYRVKFLPHPHTGDHWCIYPTYDFTHCICDSIEHIDFSLCTLEFETRRESYYWLLDALGIFKSSQWEFSRLNVTGSLLSKRKINALLQAKIVRGFDDPRLMTLVGLRRRGYTPEAINKFCELVGVTRAANVIDIKMLENSLRERLDETAPRRLGVVNPIRVKITNFTGELVIDAPNHPRKPEFGTRKIRFTETFYIDRNDFREDGSNAKFFGVAPGRTVGLKYSGNILCTGFERDAAGAISTILCTVDMDRKTKPKSNIGWVSCADAIPVELRLYEPLLTNDKAATDPDFMQFIDPNSEKICSGFVEASMSGAAIRTTVQFERIAFFTVDDDATPQRLVMNRVLSLIQDREKPTA